MVEGYNKTLLNMLGTLSEDQKTDWKSYVSTLTHAAVHESTAYAPFFLTFGRHPRLAIDAFLGLNQDIPRSHQDYVDKLKWKKDNKQCLSDTPRWSMKKTNIKNIKAIQNG